MSKKNAISYVKNEPPAFIQKFKEKIGYKEEPDVNAKVTLQLVEHLFKLWLHYSLGMPHKNQNCIIFNMMKEAIIWQKQKQKHRLTVSLAHRLRRHQPLLLLPCKEPNTLSECIWFHLKTLRSVGQHIKSSLYFLHLKQSPIYN